MVPPGPFFRLAGTAVGHYIRLPLLRAALGLACRPILLHPQTHRLPFRSGHRPATTVSRSRGSTGILQLDQLRPSPEITHGFVSGGSYALKSSETEPMKTVSSCDEECCVMTEGNIRSFSRFVKTTTIEFHRGAPSWYCANGALRTLIRSEGDPSDASASSTRSSQTGGVRQRARGRALVDASALVKESLSRPVQPPIRRPTWWHAGRRRAVSTATPESQRSGQPATRTDIPLTTPLRRRECAAGCGLSPSRRGGSVKNRQAPIRGTGQLVLRGQNRSIDHRSVFRRR